MRVAIIPAAAGETVKITDISNDMYEMQHLVDGYFQRLGTNLFGSAMYVDLEAGLKADRLPNIRASELTCDGVTILGDAVITGPADIDGNDTSLSEDALVAVKARLKTEAW